MHRHVLSTSIQIDVILQKTYMAKNLRQGNFIFIAHFQQQGHSKCWVILGEQQGKHEILH